MTAQLALYGFGVVDVRLDVRPVARPRHPLARIPSTRKSRRAAARAAAAHATA